jgi:hypothetical protein
MNHTATLASASASIARTAEVLPSAAKRAALSGFQAGLQASGLASRLKVEVASLIPLSEEAPGIISIVGVDRVGRGACWGCSWCTTSSTGSFTGHWDCPEQLKRLAAWTWWYTGWRSSYPWRQRWAWSGWAPKGPSAGSLVARHDLDLKLVWKSWGRCCGGWYGLVIFTLPWNLIYRFEKGYTLLFGIRSVSLLWLVWKWKSQGQRWHLKRRSHGARLKVWTLCAHAWGQIGNHDWR